MPEIKSIFTQGKMNKDLDERLVPKGEYRDALNIQVSTSEASDVGAVTNILGNIGAFDYNPFYGSSSPTNQIAPNAKCVGCVVDEKTDSFYWFVYHTTKSAILKYSNGQIKFIFVDTTNTVLEFTPGIITGINLVAGQDTDYLFWTDGVNEPKKIDVKLTELGTHQGGHYDTRLVIPKRALNYSSAVTFTKEYITVIKPNPKSKLLVDPIFDETIIATAEIEMDVEVGDVGEIEFDNFSPSDGSWSDGDRVLMLEQGSSLDIDEAPQATIQIINSLGEGKYNFRLLSKSDTSQNGGIPTTLTVFDCKKKRNIYGQIFPRKFVKFGYRYKYNSGEYSAFSPFTQSVFDPGAFEYSSRKAYNTAMENRLLSVKLRRFLTKQTPYDVVQIDLLYTESDSPIVYIVDKIKPFDKKTIEQGITLADRIGNYKNHWEANLYEVTSDLIYAAVPENQLLRDYDSVPITALAQEVTGSRIIYGNYEQNYNIDTTPILKAHYESRYKENPIFKHDYIGNFTDVPSPQEQNRVSLKGYKSLKSIRDYQLGIAYLDSYGRQTPIFTSNDSQFKIPKRHGSAKMKITGRVVTDAPHWAESFKIFVKETSTEYYNIALSRVYNAADGDLWLSFPSSERNKVDEDTFLFLKKAAESNALLREEYKYKVLAIENEAPDYIKEKIDKLVGLQVGDEGSPNNTLAVFGNTSSPKADSRFFEISDTIYDGTGAPNLATIEEDIYIAFKSFENDYTRRYKVAAVAKGSNVGDPYEITLEDVFDASDCSFIYRNFPPSYLDDAGTDVSMVAGMELVIYTGKEVALPEFKGVFFVKINANGADQELFLPSSEIEYEIAKSMFSHFFYDQNLLNAPVFSNYTSTTDILDNVNDSDVSSGETAVTLDISNSKNEWKELVKFGSNLSTPNPILITGNNFGNPSCGFFIDKAFYAGTAPTDHFEASLIYSSDPNYGTNTSSVSIPWSANPRSGNSYPSSLEQILTGGPDHHSPLTYGDDNWDINMLKFGKGIYKEGNDWIIELSFISNVGPHADGADGQGYGFTSSWHFLYNDILKSHLWEPQNDSRILEEYQNRYGGGTQSLQTAINRIEPNSIFKFANSVSGKKYRIKSVGIEKRYNFINFLQLTSAYYDAFRNFSYPGPQQNWDNNAGNFATAYKNFGKPVNRRITYKINLSQQNVSEEEVLINGVATPILEAAHTHQAIELQFLDIKIPDETGNIISENPAIFETEPKKTADLDLYYQASEALPLVLKDKNVETFIPLGCVVKCPNRKDVVNPNVLTYVTKAVNNVITTNTAIDFAALIGPPMLNLPAVPLYFYREDGSYTTAFVDGVGTVPEEIILTANVSRNPFALSWFNCFSFGNGVESNRIRDTFNEVIIDKGVKVSSVTDFTYEREKRKNGLIFSGIYNSNTGVNNLNQFILAEGITKDLNPTYGSIQKLFQRRDDLISFCEDRIVNIKANKDTLFNADGSSNVIATSKVLGDATPFAGDYGISRNPESFARDNYRTYFTDKQRGAVLRLSMDGLTPISEYGMSTFFKGFLKNDAVLLGSYDNKKEEYNITASTALQTISYKESIRGWSSFKSFLPEHALSVGNEYFTFKNGIPYLHHSLSTDRNSFYGISYPSTIDVVLNDSPDVIKSFKTVKYEGSKSKVKKEVSRVETGFYNLEDIDGWYVEIIQTDKQYGYVPEFIEKEGKWFNNIKGDEFNRKTDEFSFQGIGRASDIIVDPSLNPAIGGCTDINASNYDPTATFDDGSCVYVQPPPPTVINGCMDPLATNYNPAATFDDGTCVFIPPTPIYGCTNPSATNYNPAATVDDGSCVPIIMGCTDPNAINYFAGANVDDGSCLYNIVPGCTDPQATNFNPLATVDDGSCTYSPQPVPGCMDPAATNYNPLATVDDGSCTYPPVSGCTDPQAINYDPLAVVDDGSCIYQPIPVPGCTDPNASNYNPLATVDDGSCTYAPPPPAPQVLTIQDGNDDDTGTL